MTPKLPPPIDGVLAHLDDRVLGLEVPAHELVGFEDADDFLDAGQSLELEGVDGLSITDDADDRLDLALRAVRLGTRLLQNVDDVVDLDRQTHGPSSRQAWDRLLNSGCAHRCVESWTQRPCVGATI